MTVDESVRTGEDPRQVPTSTERTRSEELIIKEARRRHRRRLAAIVALVLVVATAGVLVATSLGGHGSSPIHSTTAPIGRPAPTASATPVCQSGQIQVTS